MTVFILGRRTIYRLRMSYLELLNLFEEIKTANIRIVSAGKDVLDYLIQKNILVEYSEDCYSFKMNGVFEYFLAYFMLKNDSFKKEILRNRDLYISFKNEIEIYSGLKKNDSTFLSEIYEITKKIKSDVIENERNFEEDIQTESEELKNIVSLISELKKEIQPMTLDQQDEWEDNINPVDGIEADVKVKNGQFQNIVSDYIDTLKILGRVYRNIDEVFDQDMQFDIFSFLVQETCVSITLTFDQILFDINKDKVTSDEIKKLERLLRSFSPLIAHATLFDFVAHPTLTNIIKKEIEKYSKEAHKNQFKLFVLYFMLIEIDVDENIDYIKELIDISTYWNVLYSIYVKLVSFISFKCDANKVLLEKVKNSLELVLSKMYPKKQINNVINETLKSISIYKLDEQ